MMTISRCEETTASGSPQNPKPDVICVLGMHRSGTSLLTGILNLLSVYLGSEHQLMQPDDYNPRGYWEHNEIISLNDEILARFGGSWGKPPTFPPGWETASMMADLKERALTLIQGDFVKAEIWGWKDPRTCLTLPFWQKLLPDTRYIVCLRNPVDVVHSLAYRNNFSAEKSSSLWLSYVTHALKHSDGHPRLIIFYEDLMGDWQRELRRVADFIGRPEQAENVEVSNAVREFIEQDLQHYRTSIVHTAANLRIARRARALYIAQRINVSLGREVNRQNGVDEQIEKALEILSYSFKASDQSYPPQAQLSQREDESENTIQASEARLMARGNGLETTSARLDEREQTLKALCSQLAEQDGALQTLSRQLAEKDAAVERMELQTAEGEEKIGALSAQLLDSETELKSIRNTLGWRLLSQYGRIKYGYLLPLYRLIGQVPTEPESKPTDD